MSFVSITKPTLGDPTRKSLADTIIDDLADLNARLSGSSGSVSNPSFELDVDSDGIPDGWTRTLYSGGSSGIDSTNRIHGAKSLKFTSTVLANGGGYADQTDLFAVAGGKYYSPEVWIWASVANVSAKAEVLWYDGAQSYLSTDTVASLTNTPTTATKYPALVVAPSTARYARLRLTGGVPGSGSATGTVYFDGAELVSSVIESVLTAACVSQGKLKTTTASGSISASGNYALSGGTYSWWTASSDATTGNELWFGNGNSAAGNIGIAMLGSFSFYVDERYVQASPPYSHGPCFVFAALDALGNIKHSRIAPDPPWAYHGPTDITPQMWRGDRAYRIVKLVDGVPMRRALKTPALLRNLMLGTAEVTEQEVEITLDYKDSDKAVMPHWFGVVPPGHTVVMLRPGTSLMQRLADFCDEGDSHEALHGILLAGKLNIDNTDLALPNAPPGVITVAANWKLTP